MSARLTKVQGVAQLPEPLTQKSQQIWENYTQACEQLGIEPIAQGGFRTDLLRVWAYSDFVAMLCTRHPDILHELVASDDIAQSYSAQSYQEKLKHALAELNDFNVLSETLRRFRKREILRIAFRDLAGKAELKETLADLSHLADACVGQTLSLLHGWLSRDVGEPIGAVSGEPQSLIVLGMGKLGAYELNFSSDIDLIFTYAEDGETNGTRTLSNQEFFVRLGRQLIKALDETTAHGYVFRVDMRLRPFGDSGALAVSFDAMEDYYQNHGRDWERYAMVKARPIAGDAAAGQQLMDELRPFVYRRYLDFGAFEAIRDMKAMITQQVRRKGMENNVKLGAGGIREVEFIGQVFQLIRGGRERDLQVRPILQVLERLAQKNYLPAYVVDALSDAYYFLRHTENRLQAFNDMQTHLLPEPELARASLVAAMGFESWTEFEAELKKHMKTVHEHFAQVFSAPQAETQVCDAQTALHALWSGVWSEEQSIEHLSAMGFNDGAEVYRLLAQMRDSSNYRAMSKQARERLDVLIPMVLGAAVVTSDAMATVVRLLRIIEAIGRRSAYFALLVEHPVALSQLAKLCHASPWITDYVSKHPLLLDELLDPRALYSPLSRQALSEDLANHLRDIAADDLEQQMEALRHFKQSNVLRVAAADVSKAIALMVVSDYLTEIAEVILSQVISQVWNDLSVKYGVPDVAGEGQTPGFAVIAYGKMGGIELGYGSDLDLVFLYDSQVEGGNTSGEQSIANEVFFTRLGQRIIHMLATRTPSGELYEVDMRLRPSGASGLLVTSLRAFEDYQQNDAWTWEHQALVRARFVAGDASLGEAFRQTRESVLARPRDTAQLQTDVREMRERMRKELGAKAEDIFDIKQDTGGIADIEFIVQYCVLRWAKDYKDLAQFTDNVRILETLGKLGVLQAQEADLLAEAYRVYRAEVHRLTLQGQSAKAPVDQFEQSRKDVVQIWQKYMEAAGE